MRWKGTIKRLFSFDIPLQDSYGTALINETDTRTELTISSNGDTYNQIAQQEIFHLNLAQMFIPVFKQPKNFVCIKGVTDTKRTVCVCVAMKIESKVRPRTGHEGSALLFL